MLRYLSALTALTNFTVAFVVFVALVFVSPVQAQTTYYSYLNYCAQGGQKVITNGSPANNFFQQSYPNCQVTVYYTGTTTKASLYKDAAGSTPLSNPITASAFGLFQFYTTNSYYDLVFSGSTIPSPFTWTNIGIGTTGGGGGGGSSAGPVGSIQTAGASGSFSYLTNPLPIANGGTGTAAPTGITAGSGITVTGSFPAQTVSLSGSPVIYAGTPITETPSGTINGTNASFSLSQTPNNQTLQLYKNGQLMTGGGTDYTLSGSTITFQSASLPVTGDSLLAFYLYGSTTVVGGNATSINGASVPNNAVIATNSSGQLVDGTGVVKNVNNKIIARDNNNALDYGNGSTTGIGSATTACGSSLACQVLIAPSYPTTEGTPCQVIDWFAPSQPNVACPATSNVSWYDQRYGDWRSYANPMGNNAGGYAQTSTPMNWNVVWNNPNFNLTHAENNMSGLILVADALAGGANLNDTAGGGTGYVSKTNWNGITNVVHGFTEGQHIAFQTSSVAPATGDTIAAAFGALSGGGMNAKSDEGIEGYEFDVGQIRDNNQNTGDYAATIAAISGTTLTLNATQMINTLGSGRTLLDISRPVSGTGLVTLLSPQIGHPEIVNFSGTTFTAPTVAATLGTALAYPGTSQTATPANYLYGSISGITTSTPVCVLAVGGGRFEIVQPTSVSGSSFTAKFLYPHSANDYIQVGGVCGQALVLTADQVTNSNRSQSFVASNISGTVRVAWPVLNSWCTLASGSPVACTNTQLIINNNSGNLWNPIISQQQYGVASTQGYTLYPFSYVVNQTNNSGSGDTVSLMPSPTNWTVGDTVEETTGPFVRVGGGVWKLTGNVATGAFTANSMGYNWALPLQGSDSMFAITNGWPDSAYHSYNAPGVTPGSFLGPLGVGIFGKTKYAIQIGEISDYADIAIGCPNTPQICNRLDTVISTGNINSASDYLQFNEAGSTWQFLSGNGSTAIATIVPSSGFAGTGYSPGDTFSIVQGSNTTATGIVQQVGTGGVVQYAGITGSHGTGYSVATGLSTTTLTGTGSGLKVDLTATQGQYNYFRSDYTLLPYLGFPKTPMSSKYGCTDEYSNLITTITDSQSLEPGAIITGGGGYAVPAWCYNHQWTVLGGVKPSARVGVTNHSGNLSATTICSTLQCTYGDYTVSIPLLVNSTGTSGTLTIAITYGDGYAARTYTIETYIDAGVTGSVPTTPVSIHSDGSLPISISATSTGSTVYTIYATATAQ